MHKNLIVSNNDARKDLKCWRTQI